MSLLFFAFIRNREASISFRDSLVPEIKENVQGVVVENESDADSDEEAEKK